MRDSRVDAMHRPVLAGTTVKERASALSRSVPALSLERGATRPAREARARNERLQ
jgi:hypothetical protein